MGKKKKAKTSAKKKKTGPKSVIAGKKKKVTARKKVKKKKKARGAPASNANADRYKHRFKGLALKITSVGGGRAAVAVACECSERSIFRWLKKRPSFNQAFEEGEQAFEDTAEALYRQSIIKQATPHDVVSIKVKKVEVVGQITIDGKDVEAPIPAIETETLTKKGVYDVKPLAGYIHRRRPDRYAEKRVIGASDEVTEFMDWVANRDGSDNDGSKDES